MAVTGTPPTSSSSSNPNPNISSSSASGLPPPPPPPKILLAKPSPAASAAAASQEAPPASSSSSSSGVVLRSRNAPQPGSLNLFTDSWDFHSDRVLPFLTENNDFTVIGIIGPTGVGKSTILNELYGYDGSSPGMLPPFAVQSDETRTMAKHCTTGIELRISSERLILLDTQPVFSSSVLVDMMRPDGSSAISIINGESLSADLAHELLGIQIGVFLASVCNVLLVVSEGIHDFNMWQLMLTVDLLKHSIPDPSLLIPGQSHASTTVTDKENKSHMQVTDEEYMSAPVFVHAKLRDQDMSPFNITLLKKAILHKFESSTFQINRSGVVTKEQVDPLSLDTKANDTGPDLFLLPLKVQDDLQKAQLGSYNAMLGKLRDQVLSMSGNTFAKPMSERDWLRSSGKIWESVKKSPVIAEYCRTLQSSGLFRR
ncbi:protein SMG9-like isoform X2 [Iris pallida]|uniref:Protein SMG9-like isoform X2 n=1 Tax=Iris pallida TaxID=29817 RepID=A0AAX6EZR5_IRIPA|nr:protein SMG9-like isoform X2 [Iris pallida]KAJ6823260.1 protein SMG9-like isoform X2 [Iris pallida]